MTTLASEDPQTPGEHEKEAVKAWMKVYEQGYASRDNVGVSGDDAKTQFTNGQVAMYTTGAWDFSTFEQVSFDWGFAQITPSFPVISSRPPRSSLTSWSPTGP